jgi:hypothetical protein
MLTQHELQTPIGSMVVEPAGTDALVIRRKSDRPLQSGSRVNRLKLVRKEGRWRAAPTASDGTRRLGSRKSDRSVGLSRKTVEIISGAAAAWAEQNQPALDDAAAAKAWTQCKPFWLMHIVEKLRECAGDFRRNAESGAFDGIGAGDSANRVLRGAELLDGYAKGVSEVLADIGATFGSQARSARRRGRN